MIKVLIVDDQSIIRDGLEAILSQDPELVVCGRASNGLEALKLCKEHRPDVVLMDISMPEMDGIEATKAIRKRWKGTQVLVLSMYNNHEFVNELLDAGAAGYVLKNTGRQELKEAITAVASGQRYLAKLVQVTLAESQRAKQGSDGGEHYHALTKREKEIVKLIVKGLTTMEIAEQLGLSTSTVDTHRKNIFHKLDIRNAAGLVKYAMERGWELT
ncbi:MAG: response regulator transcription factor [Flavobacteriales bacterium]|nr:response regulator transcription factor [Flavobacteriales bacterium]